VGEYDKEPWPRFQPPSPGIYRPRPSADQARRIKREQRLSEHVERHRVRGAPPRRRDGGLSRAEIVDAAIAVADAEGPDAVSMRRIARELRAGAMSLYWHVASKEELIDLMLDSLEAEMRVPEPTGDWRADLAELARRQRAGLLRHPWVMEFAASRPPSGPNDARNLERMLGIVGGLGLDARTTVDVLMAAVNYVLGAVLREVQEMRSERNRVAREATMTAEEINAERERFRSWLTASDRYPNIQAMVAANVDPDAPETRDERFEFGLGCLLDGIAALLPGSLASWYACSKPARTRGCGQRPADPVEDLHLLRRGLALPGRFRRRRGGLRGAVPARPGGGPGVGQHQRAQPAP
jgi:AcrR family transcriptional regulator